MIRIDRRDLEFQLFEMLPAAELHEIPRFSDWDRTAIEAVLETAERVAMDHFLPHAADLDLNEPRFVDGRAEMDPRVGAALAVYREAGFFAAGFDAEWGGAQMPETVRSAASFIFSTANIGTAGYPFLTNGVANLIAAFGSTEQKKLFLKLMVEGRFFGTMCLSEPDAGSSLADITTRAEDMEDGTYRITGRKMWISAGEQEISENIVHMVLAKIPGGPPGVKGISLFIVPKYLLGPDGAIGARNGVALAGLNHKMGYRATTNAALNFGEDGPCIGYLVGEPHRGLSYMFQMMNEARIGVGMGAAALGAAGYQVSLAYARERPQGRPLEAKGSTSSKPVPIIEHADIRRLLLAQKAAVEGSLALLLHASHLVDLIRTERDDDRRRELELLLDLLTPIAKSWPSEFCLEANKHAIQVLGGYGYTRDYPVERFYRDNRLNPIHEGTHGIQGIDLLGRKVMQAGGAGLKALAGRIMKDVQAANGVEHLGGHGASLATHLSESIATTRKLVTAAAGNPALGLANATIYLDMLGHIVIGWMWLKQATVAAKALAGDTDRDFMNGKLAACRYFFAHELPKARTQRALLDRLDETTLGMQPNWF